MSSFPCFPLHSISLILSPSQMGREGEVRCCPSPQRKGGEDLQLHFLGIHSAVTEHLRMWGTLCRFSRVEWQWLGWARDFLLAQNQHKADLRQAWGLGFVSWQLRCINSVA